MLELCSGGSVTQLLNFHMQHHLPLLKEEEIAYILSEVTHALVYLNSHNTLHRDIKGSNIVSACLGKRIFSAASSIIIKTFSAAPDL